MKLARLINKEGRGVLGMIYQVVENDPEHSQVKLCDTDGRYCFFTDRKNIEKTAPGECSIPTNVPVALDIRDSQEVENRALRYNSGKLQWSLVDFELLEPMVEVLMFGAEKYAPNNWKKGLPVTEVIDCLLRHTLALKKGEDLDPESGKHHIGHAMCNLMFIMHFLKNDPSWDDR